MISHSLNKFIVSVGMGHRVEEGVEMEAVEYRAVIRFLFSTDRTPNETEMTGTYGEDFTLSKMSRYVWALWRKSFMTICICGSCRFSGYRNCSYLS